MKENDNRVHMLSYNNQKKEQLYERYVGAQKQMKEQQEQYEQLETVR